MPKDLKYGHVTCERGDIADEEPVFLFRAKDKLLVHLLRIYRILCMLAGSPRRHLDGIDAAIEQILAWQRDHFTQVPKSAPVGESSDG